MPPSNFMKLNCNHLTFAIMLIYLFLHLFMAHEYLINNGDRVSYLKIKSTYRIKSYLTESFKNIIFCLCIHSTFTKNHGGNYWFHFYPCKPSIPFLFTRKQSFSSSGLIPPLTAEKELCHSA